MSTTLVGGGALDIAGAAAFTGLWVQETKFLIELAIKPDNPYHDDVIRLYATGVAVAVVILAELASSTLRVHNLQDWLTAIVQGFGVGVAAISGYHLLNGFSPQTVPVPKPGTQPKPDTQSTSGTVLAGGTQPVAPEVETAATAATQPISSATAPAPDQVTASAPVTALLQAVTELVSSSAPAASTGATDMTAVAGLLGALAQRVSRLEQSAAAPAGASQHASGSATAVDTADRPAPLPAATDAANLAPADGSPRLEAGRPEASSNGSHSLLVPPVLPETVLVAPVVTADASALPLPDVPVTPASPFALDGSVSDGHVVPNLSAFAPAFHPIPDLQVAPTSGPPGTPVTLRGSNFDDPGLSVEFVHATRPLEGWPWPMQVSSRGPTEIQGIVPAEVLSLEKPFYLIRVTTNAGSTISTTLFTATAGR